MNFDWLNGTFEEFMKLAALRLLAEREKRADVMGEAAQQAQGARQQLGILGADPKKIDAGLGRLNAGEIGPWRARRQLSSAVPGVGEQLGNVPAGVSTAVQQGDLGGAAAQADVAGLKNVIPGTEHFSPATLMASGLLGGTAAAGQGMAAQARQRQDVLHGRVARDELNGLLDKPTQARLTEWRQNNVPKSLGEEMAQRTGQTRSLAGKARAGAGVLGGRLSRAFLGPGDTTLVPGMTTTGPGGGLLGGVQKRVEPVTLPVGKLDEARRIYNSGAKATAAEGKGGLLRGAGRVARRAWPAMAAASLPLLYREWLSGSGYRSGNKPINDLVEANQTLQGAQP